MSATVEAASLFLIQARTIRRAQGLDTAMYFALQSMLEDEALSRIKPSQR